jgi:gamma-glutamyltranspeptidase/glutathione hydrolase
MDSYTRTRQLRGVDAATVTGHPAATAVAGHILRSGGNAFDAAIAAAAASAVVRPHMCGLGADGFILVYDAKTKKVHAINAAGPAPAAASAALFAAGIPDRGPRCMTVPGIVDGWGQVHARFGSLSWQDVLAPAAELAERGFAVYRSHRHWLSVYEDRYAADGPCASVFLPKGRVPDVGDVIRQPALASALRILGRNGYRDFYEGEIAASTTRYMADKGGLIAADDLRAFSASWADPVSSAYRGCRLHTQPPTSQGWMLAQMAGALDGIDIAALGVGTKETTSTLIDIVRCSYSDRNEQFGDPKFVKFSLDERMSQKRLEAIRSAVGERHAEASAAAYGGDTSSLSVVDAEGNGIAMIQSLYVDSAAMTPDTGIVFNGRLSSCSNVPGHPNEIVGGKTPVHTMHTYMVTRDDALYLLGGTPGGQAQIQCNLQVIVNIVDFGMEPQEAVEAPRFLVGGANKADDLSLVFLEGRFSEETARYLAAQGSRIDRMPDWAMDWVENVSLGTVGSEKMIAIDPATGVRLTGVDPRRDAHGLAW